MENILPQVNQFLVEVVLPLVAVIGAVVGSWVLKRLPDILDMYVQSRVTEFQYSLIRTFAVDVVQAIEQEDWKSLNSQQKKEEALLRIGDYVDEKGWEISENLINQFIESAVWATKTSLGTVTLEAAELE